MQHPTLLVTGVSGPFGREVMNELLAHPQGPLIGATRSPERAQALAQRGVELRRADFDRPDALASAFRGARHLLIVSTGAEYGGPRRVQQHRHAVDAAVAAGVRRLAYTSLQQADASPLGAMAHDHAQTEAMLAATGLPCTVLRNAFYAEMLLMRLPLALASGEWPSAAGDGRIAYVARDGCAAAAAAALRNGGGSGCSVLDITGPAALAAEAVVGVANDVLGTRIVPVRVSGAEFERRLQAAGLPRTVASALGHIEAGVARGAMERCSSDGAALTGRSPRSVGEFLSAHRERLVPGH